MRPRPDLRLHRAHQLREPRKLATICATGGVLRAERGSLMRSTKAPTSCRSGVVGPHAQRAARAGSASATGFSGTVMREGDPWWCATWRRRMESRGREELQDRLLIATDQHWRPQGRRHERDGTRRGRRLDEMTWGCRHDSAADVAGARTARVHQKATQSVLSYPLTGCQRRYWKNGSRKARPLERNPPDELHDGRHRRLQKLQHTTAPRPATGDRVTACLKSALPGASLALRGEECRTSAQRASRKRTSSPRIRRRVERNSSRTAVAAARGRDRQHRHLAWKGLDAPASIIYAADQDYTRRRAAAKTRRRIRDFKAGDADRG